MTKKRLIDCTINGKVRNISPEKDYKGKKNRMIQVEMFNDKKSVFEDVSVTEWSPITIFEVGSDVSIKVSVGAEVFGGTKRAKFTVLDNFEEGV
jgi:hypothetical protein